CQGDVIPTQTICSSISGSAVFEGEPSICFLLLNKVLSHFLTVAGRIVSFTGKPRCKMPRPSVLRHANVNSLQNQPARPFVSFPRPYHSFGNSPASAGAIRRIRFPAKFTQEGI